jgi:hypothetical protein
MSHFSRFCWLTKGFVVFEVGSRSHKKKCPVNQLHHSNRH